MEKSDLKLWSQWLVNLRQLVKENQAKVDQKLEEKALLKSRL